VSEKYGRYKSQLGQYEIFICNSDNIEKYYAAFKDVNGLSQEIEITEGVYLEFLKSFRGMNSHRWRSWYHSTIIGLHDNMILSMSAPGIEDTVIQRELVENIEKIVTALPAKQRRRFVLYYEYGFTYEKIALAEKCSIASIERSIKKVKRKVIAEISKESY